MRPLITCLMKLDELLRVAREPMKAQEPEPPTAIMLLPMPSPFSEALISHASYLLGNTPNRLEALPIDVVSFGEPEKNGSSGTDDPMSIQVVFNEGPLHDMKARVTDLPALQIFFDKRQRAVYCYKKINETVYVFLPEVSQGLTDIYDKTYAKFGDKGQSVESWVERV